MPCAVVSCVFFTDPKNMPPGISVQRLAPEGFLEYSKSILFRVRSTAHDIASSDQELDLQLGELLLDRVIACLVEKYSDDGYGVEDLTMLLYRTLENSYASESSTFTTSKRLFLAQIRVRVVPLGGLVGRRRDDTTGITSPFVCTPRDLQGLSVVTAGYPSLDSCDRGLCSGLLLAHNEWVKKKTQTSSARLEHRARRRKSLYKRRCEACNMMPGLVGFAGYLDNWGIDLVSEDESSGEDSGYSIMRLSWRSAAATNFLRSLDAVYLSSRYKDGKSGRGSVPRERYPCLRYKSSTPKPGLPRNLYNKLWWEGLGEDERKLLDAREPLSLELPSDVKRVVERFQFRG